MTHFTLKRCAAALALVAAGLPAHAAEPVKLTLPVASLDKCDKPVWPRESLRFEQQGAVTLAFLVDPEGAVRESKIVASSGFPLLDVAARDGIARCRFAPGQQDGKPVTAWARMQYVWTLTPVRAADDAEQVYGTASAADKAAIAAAAEGGAPKALEMLTRAAVRGNVAAQLWMAERYAAGKGVLRNDEAAAAWYRKAAAAGDNAARQGLARLYDEGLGVPLDKAAAMALRKAAAAPAP